MEQRREPVFIVYNSSKLAQSVCRVLAKEGRDLVFLSLTDKRKDLFVSSLPKDYGISVEHIWGDFFEQGSSGTVWNWCIKKKISFNNFLIFFEQEIEYFKEMSSVSEKRSKQIKFNLALVEIVYMFLTQMGERGRKYLMFISDPLKQEDLIQRSLNASCREFVISFSKVLLKEMSEYNTNLLTMAFDYESCTSGERSERVSAVMNVLNEDIDTLARKTIAALFSSESTSVHTIEDIQQLLAGKS